MLYMENASGVARKGTVVLEHALGNRLTLKDILYVPEIMKNLVSGFYVRACTLAEALYHYFVSIKNLITLKARGVLTMEDHPCS